MKTIDSGRNALDELDMSKWGKMPNILPQVSHNATNQEQYLIQNKGMTPEQARKFRVDRDLGKVR